MKITYDTYMVTIKMSRLSWSVINRAIRHPNNEIGVRLVINQIEAADKMEAKNETKNNGLSIGRPDL